MIFGIGPILRPPTVRLPPAGAIEAAISAEIVVLHAQKVELAVIREDNVGPGRHGPAAEAEPSATEAAAASTAAALGERHGREQQDKSHGQDQGPG
jgi:hypothetical protein